MHFLTPLQNNYRKNKTVQSASWVSAQEFREFTRTAMQAKKGHPHCAGLNLL